MNAKNKRPSFVASNSKSTMSLPSSARWTSKSRPSKTSSKSTANLESACVIEGLPFQKKTLIGLIQYLLSPKKHRRKDEERARIAELEEQKRQLEAMKNNIDAKALAEAKEKAYNAEIAQATTELTDAENAFTQGAQMLTKAMSDMKLEDRFSSASFHALSAEFARQIAELETEKKAIDEPENQSWIQANPNLTVDRCTTLLFGDVHKSNWMINPNKGQSSSETLQR
jgi:hypothetical protein